MYLPVDKIDAFVNELDRDTKAIKEDLLRICWFMRGGIPYSEALNLSHDERELIGKIINNNLEVTKETQMPFF